MIAKLSCNIVKHISKNISLSSEEKEEYSYAINILLSYALHLTTLLIIVTLTKMYWQGFLYNFSYIFLRSYAGGFHAKSPKVCYFLSILICTASLLVIKYASFNFSFITALSLISYLIIMVLSPVEDKNKPLDEIETKIFKFRARIIASAYLAVIILGLILGYKNFSFVLALSLAVLSFMVILGLIKNKLNS